jgi:hypothetical protein
MAVRPMRPATASALTMCRTTPVSRSASHPREHYSSEEAGLYYAAFLFDPDS